MTRFIAAGLIVACFSACSKKNASHTSLAQQPHEQTEPVVAPEPAAINPAGPVAGSVFDVVSPNSGMPQDVLRAMAQYEIKSLDRHNLWRTHALDIDGDGSKELFVSNVFEWCGSGGCGVWLWQRTRKGLRNLLPTENILAEAVSVEDSSSGGYRNLRIYSRKFSKQQESILVSDLYVWRNTKYVLAASKQLGKYLQSSLPPAAWKVVP
jgi:hypothetical protein